MKIGAHPLVVAAALGLLGPAALEEEGESEVRGEGLREERLEHAPDASEQARIERLWQQARARLD